MTTRRTVLSFFSFCKLQSFSCIGGASGQVLASRTERVGDVHLDIFVGDLLKSCFGHLFDCSKRLRKELRHCKLETALCDIHRANLTSKVVQTTKQVGVDLLQAFDRADLDIVD